MPRFFATACALLVGLGAGAVGTYLWISGEPGTGGPLAAESLKHATPSARLAALAGDNQKGPRQIGIVGPIPQEKKPSAGGPPTERDTTGPALDTLNSYVGTTELGDNKGPAIERFLAHVGLDEGYAYCAAAISYALDAPPDSIAPMLPTTRSPTAQDFDNDLSVSPRVAVRMGTVPQGWINVFRKGQGPYGHAGMVLHWRGECGRTVSANTSKGEQGNQRDGEGIWRRTRCWEPNSYFSLSAFTPVVYRGRAPWQSRKAKAGAEDRLGQSRRWAKRRRAFAHESNDSNPPPQEALDSWRYGSSYSKTRSR